MNPFESIHNDTVYILRKDGTRSENYKTRVGSKGGHAASIYVDDINVSEGDTLIRVLPNKKEEQYTILDVDYSPGLLDDIPPHWNLKLEKTSSLKRSSPAPTSQTFHINNSQGIQIGDHNLQHIEASITGLIEKIDKAETSDAEKDAAKGKIRQMLENPTVAAVLGSSAATLLSMF
ncbi:RIP homotypic interaction motif-containing protein [Salinicola sp. CPA57]|uniref:RIP homotypic interaction motif-containing protein n=1 Tax=Salinicola sp. CPA57 TaxID=1949080 RepID=UPI000DA13E0A|nr:RIP homotypic interaction motif-containing protein [Salinicola sp. CPA57]